MDQDKLLAILKEFDNSSVVSLKYKEDETEFVLKKEGAYLPASMLASMPASSACAPVAQVNANPSATTAIPSADSAATSAVPAEDATLVTIKSPIVGTFYRAPSPDSPAYVDEGTRIQMGSPLCILEAMKMMNTLESEYDGIIVKILANTGDLVEFDQPLFTVRVQ